MRRFKKTTPKQEKPKSGINREKLGKNNLFPKIYRIITDTKFIISFVSFILICFIAFEAFVIWKDIEVLKEIKKEKQIVKEEIKHWEDVVINHPDYRDGYFKLATLEYKIRNKGRSKWYLEKTIELDPNFEGAKKLAELLN
ncbi:MAG: hypothetical protein Q8P10_03665 [bacterium]|nr:hypothetical protein [bacterium]